MSHGSVRLQADVRLKPDATTPRDEASNLRLPRPPQLPKHVGEDPAVLEGDELFRRVDSHERAELDRLAAVYRRLDLHLAAGPQTDGHARHRVLLSTAEADSRRRLPVFE